MPLARFQKVAIGALFSLLLLILAGAVVRVSGAGMGCPDWPTCWGCLVPPTKLADVDFSKLQIQKFKDKAAREGRDPNTITVETLRQEFNPRLAWTEYLNRLSSTPLSLFTLSAFILSFWEKKKRPIVFWISFAAVVVLLVEAWMGARIVYSGLKPGIITTHLALAMAMFGLFMYSAWRGTDHPWRVKIASGAAGKLRLSILALLALVIAEGILGSQIRELTDEMAKTRHLGPGADRIALLEQTTIYLVHRSFSWSVLLAALIAYTVSRRHGHPGRVAKTVLTLVWGQMALGVIMSWVHLYAWVQVVHVALAAILLSMTWLWLFGAWNPVPDPEEA